MSKQNDEVKKTIVDSFFEEEKISDERGFLAILIIFGLFFLFSLGCTIYGYINFTQWIIELIKKIT